MRQTIEGFRELFEDMAREYRRQLPGILVCARGFALTFVLILIGTTARQQQDVCHGSSWLLEVVGWASMLSAMACMCWGLYHYFRHDEATRVCE